jgi:N-acetylneuraminic acid mutarotase
LNRVALVLSLTLSISVPVLQGVIGAEETAVTFVPTGQPHTKRYSEHTATRLQDGTVLVAGGWDGTSGRSSSRLKAAAEIFNSQTNEWTAVASMNRARNGHSATLLASGKVLVVGGPDAELFDPTTKKWFWAGKLAQPRGRHTATRLEDGRVAVVGGFISEGEVTASVELYNPKTAKWFDGGQLLEPRAYQTALGLDGNRVLLAGGENPRNTPTAEIHSALTSRSTVTAPLQKPHAFCQAWVRLNDGRLLVTGGEGTDATWPPVRGVPPEHVALAEIYNPATNMWTLAKPMTSIRCGHSATVLRDGRVFVMGGERGAGTTTEFFEPKLDEWSSGPKLPRSYRGHTATLLFDGRILIVGGNRRHFAPIVATITTR